MTDSDKDVSVEVAEGVCGYCGMPLDDAGRCPVDHGGEADEGTGIR